MINDTDRREVARRLRDANHHSCSPDCELRYALDDCYDCIGNGCAGCHRDAFDRLADLIDPDVSPTRHRHVGGKKTSQTPSQCDRDALLALADEMDAYSGHFRTGLQGCAIQAWAMAIIEALEARL